MKTPRIYSKLTTFAVPLLAGLLLSAPAAFAADESCSSCGPDVRINGEFVHRKDAATVTIQGAPADNAPAFLEEINGNNFNITIGHLPAGRYTISIGEVETLATAAGARVFDVSAGDVALAKNFDIFAAAGGAGKVTTITGTVQHEDDEIRGPINLVFSSSKGTAKFNTVEIKNAAGASVIAFKASELADNFSADARHVPEISGPTIWTNSAQPLKERINDLIRRMSLAEKVAQLQGGQTPAPAIARLGLPSYAYWNEALHGVANNGTATVFPEPVGMASTWNPELMHKEGHVVGIEGRAKYNAYANANNGNSSWWHGLTFWTRTSTFSAILVGAAARKPTAKTRFLQAPCLWTSSKEFRGTTPMSCWRWHAQNITRSTAARRQTATALMPSRRRAICMRRICPSLKRRFAWDTLAA